MKQYMDIFSLMFSIMEHKNVQWRAPVLGEDPRDTQEIIYVLMNWFVFKKSVLSVWCVHHQFDLKNLPSARLYINMWCVQNVDLFGLSEK